VGLALGWAREDIDVELSAVRGERRGDLGGNGGRGPGEDVSETGEQQAGLGITRWARNRAGEVVAVAQTGFDEAVRRAVGLNVPAFLAAAEALQDPPAEMEITFGLKGTGEVGNVAVGKVAGECSYQVKMVWRRRQS
jgi:hypothetical protein